MLAKISVCAPKCVCCSESVCALFSKWEPGLESSLAQWGWMGLQSSTTQWKKIRITLTSTLQAWLTCHNLMFGAVDWYCETLSLISLIFLTTRSMCLGVQKPCCNSCCDCNFKWLFIWLSISAHFMQMKGLYLTAATCVGSLSETWIECFLLLPLLWLGLMAVELHQCRWYKGKGMHLSVYSSLQV